MAWFKPGSLFGPMAPLLDYLYPLVPSLQLQEPIKGAEQNMNFLSFSNVSQLQANTQLINEHINQAHSQEASQQKEIDFDSPILHKRTHSESSFPAIFSPGRIDQICQLSQKPEKGNQASSNRFFNEHALTKRGNFPRESEELKLKMKKFVQRKYSQNHVIFENQQNEKDPDLVAKLRTQEVGVLTQNNLLSGAKSRKGSCNLETLAFFKRHGRKNSDHCGFIPERLNSPVLKNKNIHGWNQDTNFNFASKNSSDTFSKQELLSPVSPSPLSKLPRKNSDFVESPQKVASFINYSKRHRNSVNQVGLKQEPILSISDFIIIKELGKGTFGRVVLAVEKVSRMVYAIKIISKRQVKQNDMLEQLKRELKIHFYLNSPNIIKVHGFFDDVLSCYIIEECVLDGHLSSHIKKTAAPILQPQAASYLNQICSAVSTLHTSAIIHRDLKPENVLLHEGIVKLCDFGWSVHLDSALRTTFCGTPVYLCPEILVGDEYNESIDIWSIGMILYEMFFKTNPFQVTCQEDLVNIVNKPIYFDEKVAISEWAKDFITICLSKRASERPNIRELLLHPFLLNVQSPKEEKLKPF